MSIVGATFTSFILNRDSTSVSACNVTRLSSLSPPELVIRCSQSSCLDDLKKRAALGGVPVLSLRDINANPLWSVVVTELSGRFIHKVNNARNANRTSTRRRVTSQEAKTKLAVSKQLRVR